MKVDQVYITYKNGTTYEFAVGPYDLQVGDEELEVSAYGQPLLHAMIENIKDFGVTL